MAFRHHREAFILRIGGAIGRPRSEPDARRLAFPHQRVAIDVLVMEDQRGVHHRGEVGQHLRVDFDVERTHHGADPPDAEPQQQLLQVLVGQQQHAAALGDAAALEEGGDVGGDLVEGAEADRGAGLEIDDGGLAGIAIPVMRKQLRDGTIGNAELMVAEHARHRLPPVSLFVTTPKMYPVIPGRALARTRNPGASRLSPPPGFRVRAKARAPE